MSGLVWSGVWSGAVQLVGGTDGARPAFVVSVSVLCRQPRRAFLVVDSAGSIM